jgi:hypothetical protein
VIVGRPGCGRSVGWTRFPHAALWSTGSLVSAVDEGRAGGLGDVV